MGSAGSGSWPALSMAGGVVPEKQPGNEMSGAADPRFRVASEEGGNPWERLVTTAVPNQGEVGKTDRDSTLFGAIRSSSSSRAAAPTRRERRRPLSPMWSALPGDERDVGPASERSSEPMQ